MYVGIANRQLTHTNLVQLLDDFRLGLLVLSVIHAEPLVELVGARKHLQATGIQAPNLALTHMTLHAAWLLREERNK